MTLLLTRSECARVADLPTTVALVRDAFAAQGRGEALDPTRVHVHATGGGFHVVVGGVPVDGAPSFATKINASFEPGPGQGGLRLVGLVVLSDAATGEPVAVLDSGPLTRYRTAAFTAVALGALARRDSARLVLAGAGRQAPLQLDAARLALPGLTELAVWSPTDGRAAALADAAGPDVHALATTPDALADAVAGADVVVTVTPARGALFPADAVRPGTTVVALGADAPGKQELDPALLRRARYVPDITAQCLVGGELQHAGSDGPDPADLHTLGEVLAGRAAGRTDPDQIVVADSTGTAMQDVAGALALVRAATAAGLGRDLDFSA